MLESCTEELDRMSRMVSDMLFLAQVSHPASMVEFEPVSLVDEVQRVCDLFSISAEDGEIQLQISGSDDVVRGNRLMIQRAVSNLVSNAIRYCPRGRTVYVKVQRGGSGTTLSVGNPGRGIAKEHHAHLFERFYRVDKSRARSEGDRSWPCHRAVDHEPASRLGERGSDRGKFHLVPPSLSRSPAKAVGKDRCLKRAI